MYKNSVQWRKFAYIALFCAVTGVFKEGKIMEKRKESYCNVFGEPQKRQEVLKAIEADAETLKKFQKLSEELQEELLEFCMENWGVKMTYDPFF